MKCFACDAGPTRWGCATVELDEKLGRLFLREGTHRVVDANSDADIVWMRARIEEVRLGGMVLAEQIVGYAYDATRVAGLVETARSEGVLLGAARVLGVRHKFYSANDVRGALCFDRQANDDMVACVVEYLYGKAVREKLKPSERPHVYDAMLLAAYGLTNECKIKVVLPSRIRAELAQLKAAQMAGVALRKAQKALAKPIGDALLGAARTGAVVTYKTLLGLMGRVTPEDVTAGLRTLAKAHKEPGPTARRILVDAGIPTTDPTKKRSPTRAQTARRSAAHKRKP